MNATQQCRGRHPTSPSVPLHPLGIDAVTGPLLSGSFCAAIALSQVLQHHSFVLARGRGLCPSCWVLGGRPWKSYRAFPCLYPHSALMSKSKPAEVVAGRRLCSEEKKINRVRGLLMVGALVPVLGSRIISFGKKGSRLGML